MDVSTAHGVRGLKPKSSLEEAKKVFDARAIRLHPDQLRRVAEMMATGALTEEQAETLSRQILGCVA